MGLLLFGASIISGCLRPLPIRNPKRLSTVEIRDENMVSGELLMRFKWAFPTGKSDLAVVMVYPPAGKGVELLSGVITDLAEKGYAAVAVDYKRLIKGRYRKTLFVWRKPEDVLKALSRIQAHPRIDSDRIASLGFSQGGVFSLIMAAHSSKISAVIAYYPVTDFEEWMYHPGGGAGRKLVFKFIRRHFRKESGAENEKQFRRILAEASPINYAKRINVPVLLIHGENDTSAPISESNRLLEKLHQYGTPAKLVEIKDAGHVFNFKNRKKSDQARGNTLQWLDRFL